MNYATKLTSAKQMFKHLKQIGRRDIHDKKTNKKSIKISKKEYMPTHLNLICKIERRNNYASGNVKTYL